MSEEKKRWAVKDTDGDIIFIEATLVSTEGCRLKFTDNGKLVAIFDRWASIRQQAEEKD